MRVLVSLLAALLVVVVASAAAANVGAPWSGGQLVGESPGLADVLITREQLEIDMRALASGGLVTVSAAYDLDNRGTDKELDLLFASGATRHADVRVTLDGAAVPTHATPQARIPESWRAPTTTPRADGTGALSYDLQGDDHAPFGFRLALPAGAHRLVVSDAADARVYRVGDPTVVHQFAYVLAPARTWGGFGGLDVTLRVPSGWRAATTPPLARDGDTLRAAFAELPADALAIATQAPAPMFHVVRAVTLALLGLVTLGGVILVPRLARRRARTGESAGRATLGAVGLGIAWSASVFFVGCAATFAPGLTVASPLADDRGYGAVLALFATTVGAALTFVLGTALALLARRRRA